MLGHLGSGAGDQHLEGGADAGERRLDLQTAGHLVRLSSDWCSLQSQTTMGARGLPSQLGRNMVEQAAGWGMGNLRGPHSTLPRIIDSGQVTMFWCSTYVTLAIPMRPRCLSSSSKTSHITAFSAAASEVAAS